MVFCILCKKNCGSLKATCVVYILKFLIGVKCVIVKHSIDFNTAYLKQRKTQYLTELTYNNALEITNQWPEIQVFICIFAIKSSRK